MKILVVDDEHLARERLLRLLADLRPDDTLLQAGDGDSAIALADTENPDLVLLDVRMPGSDGLDVAAALDALERPPAVAFCTAYDEYALQALQCHAIAYLVKPVRKQALAECLQAAGRVNRAQLATLRESSDSGTNRVSSHTHRGFESLPVDDVRCFLAEDKYVTAITPEHELTLSETLKELEDNYPSRFIRVHRNALVALDHIERLARTRDGSWEVVLRGIAQRPTISRRHLSQVKKRFAGETRD